MPKCKRKRKFKWNNNKIRLNKHCPTPWICSCSWFHFLPFPYSGDSTYTMFILELISQRVVLKLRYGSTIFEDFTQVHCRSLGAREGVCWCLWGYKACSCPEPAGICSSSLKHNSQNAYAVTGARSWSVSKYLPIHKLAWHEDTDIQLSAASSEASLCARTPAAWLVMSL